MLFFSRRGDTCRCKQNAKGPNWPINLSLKPMHSSAERLDIHRIRVDDVLELDDVLEPFSRKGMSILVAGSANTDAVSTRSVWINNKMICKKMGRSSVPLLDIGWAGQVVIQPLSLHPNFWQIDDELPVRANAWLSEATLPSCGSIDITSPVAFICVPSLFEASENCRREAGGDFRYDNV